jgi:hypothetical protein
MCRVVCQHLDRSTYQFHGVWAKLGSVWEGIKQSRDTQKSVNKGKRYNMRILLRLIIRETPHPSNFLYFGLRYFSWVGVDSIPYSKINLFFASFLCKNFSCYPAN